ncbi:MAG: TlyA family RNA methyltransferase [bacterium]
MGSKTTESKSNSPLIKPELALVESGLAKDLVHARSLMSCGLVFFGDQLINANSKITEQMLASQGLRVKYKKEYVSRGAVKLESVFKSFDLNVNGFICMDIGASTGGFTQLLLQKGAASVFAIDVGKGILDHKLRTDNRVNVMEGINARFLNEHELIKKEIKDESIDICVMDLSFISLKLIIPNIYQYIKRGGYLIPLIKPQFEAPRDKIESGGVVRDPLVIEKIISDIKELLENMGTEILKVVPSEIRGPSGNLEYFCVTRRKL